MGQQQQQWQFI